MLCNTRVGGQWLRNAVSRIQVSRIQLSSLLLAMGWRRLEGLRAGVSQEGNCFSINLLFSASSSREDVSLAVINNHKDLALAHLSCGCQICLSLTVNLATCP